MFWIILTGLLPSFLLIGLGGLLRKRLSENAWQGLDKLNFEILFPALIFTTAAARPIDPAQLLIIGPLVWAILVLGLGLGWLARPFGPARFLDFAGGWQCAWRFNTALGFVVVSALPSADIGLFSIAIGLAIPVGNVFAVAALSRGEGLSLITALRKVALNPFLLASLAGVAVGLSSLTIPAPVAGADLDAGAGGHPGGTDLDRGDAELVRPGPPEPVFRDTGQHQTAGPALDHLADSFGVGQLLGCRASAGGVCRPAHGLGRACAGGGLWG